MILGVIGPTRVRVSPWTLLPAAGPSRGALPHSHQLLSQMQLSPNVFGGSYRRWILGIFLKPPPRWMLVSDSVRSFQFRCTRVQDVYTILTVCSIMCAQAVFGHTNPKVWNEPPPHWMLFRWFCQEGGEPENQRWITSLRPKEGPEGIRKHSTVIPKDECERIVHNWIKRGDDRTRKQVRNSTMSVLECWK